jgi:hypothetical protein
MNGTNQDRSGWETEEQVSACLVENDVSRAQIARWRRVGLLPDVEQVQNAYRGSTVLYPPGTCKQIAAAARLFREKNRADYVGRMLWWEGFPVDKRYWKPDLIRLAVWVDRICILIKPLMHREDDNLPTLPERLSASNHPDIIFSRVRPRLDREELQSFLRVALDTATGEFDRFEEPEGDDRSSFDEAAIVSGLDIAASGTHSILGQRLKIKDGIENTLRALAKVIRVKWFSDVATGPEEIIFAARNDLRNDLRIGLALYEAFEWIYGRHAFGLRHVAWIAKKRPVRMFGVAIIGFALLRQSSNELLPSEEISRLADQAELVLGYSRQLRQLWKSDPRFKNVLNPKRVREGLRDQPSLNNWKREIAAAAGKPSSKG